MKLVDNWRDVPRMISVQMLALIATVQGILAAATPEQVASLVPFTMSTTWANLGSTVTLTAAVIGGIGRFIDQGLGNSK